MLAYSREDAERMRQAPTMAHPLDTRTVLPFAVGFPYCSLDDLMRTLQLHAQLGAAISAVTNSIERDGGALLIPCREGFKPRPCGLTVGGVRHVAGESMAFPTSSESGTAVAFRDRRVSDVPPPPAASPPPAGLGRTPERNHPKPCKIVKERLTLAQKLAVIDAFEAGANITRLSRSFGTSRAAIRRVLGNAAWYRQLDQEGAPRSSKRCKRQCAGAELNRMDLMSLVHDFKHETLRVCGSLCVGSAA